MGTDSRSKADVTEKDLGGPFNTRKHLANAALEAEKRRFADLLIVDMDAHHYEHDSWKEIFEYVEDPVMRQRLHAAAGRSGRTVLFPLPIGDQDVAGRLSRLPERLDEVVDGNQRHRDVEVVRRYMESMGIDYSILFPTPMLSLGMHPQAEVEVALARAYARWLAERVLSVEPSIKTMLYLPFNDPAASHRMVEEFSDVPGVIGFMVTSVHHRQVHHNDYMRLYAALEERDMPLGFHAVYTWHGDRSMEQLNRFLSVHALAFPFYNMVHLTNWVINGIPERFPGLKAIWIESGIAWLPFLMERLDHQYMMRSSEAPLLTRRPSEYIREMYYTTQPLERGNLNFLKLAFDMLNAETQLMYSSDYPHWDFDLPSAIYDLPFLDERAKRGILGENARRVFRLDEGGG
ncbi:MAG: amidohydrolase family protein [Gemmatimonas sp.]|nr:amidohydrolase family protein [Gemmatimonas sp.]